MAEQIEWLSTGQASKRIGVIPRTLYRIIDTGELPAYRVGRVIRLQVNDIDAYIAGCRITPGTLTGLCGYEKDDNDVR